MSSWLTTAELYFRPRVLGIFFLSFSSGLPFLLTLSTLSVWLMESGISKTTMGLLVLCTLPYSLKLFWAPLIDKYKLPFLGQLLGKRRSWLFISQVFLLLSIIGLGMTNPATQIELTALMIFCVAFCSASQDCIFEAYRLEILQKSHRGAGAGISVMGYRVGMLVSSTGALYLATFFTWGLVYTMMALCIMIGIIATLCNGEPKVCQNTYPNLTESFKDLFKRPNIWLVLAFILLFKVGDTVLNVMSTRFMLEVGFSKLEIANVAKFYGISSMIIGGLVGGICLGRYRLLDNLLLCSGLQVIASLLFMVQASLGYNLSMLIITVGIENLACGMGAAAFIAYISNQCELSLTATHYAFFSSCASLARIILSTLAPLAADQLEWMEFYGLVALACTPCFVLLLANKSRFALPSPAESTVLSRS